MSDDLVERLQAGSIWGRSVQDTLIDWMKERKQAADHIEELEAKLAKAVEALDEAVYLLAPDEKDMMRQAGVYRVVTTLAELKGL